MAKKILDMKGIKIGSLGVELINVSKHISDDGNIFYTFALFYDGKPINMCKYTSKNLNMKDLRKVISNNIVGCLSSHLKRNLN